MLTRIAALLGGVPIPAVVALLVLAAIQIPLQVYCLIDLARRTRVPGGRKWVWALVIVAGNLIGAIVYVAMMRGADRALPVGDERAAGSAGTVARERALDRLYGDKNAPHP